MVSYYDAVRTVRYADKFFLIIKKQLWSILENSFRRRSSRLVGRTSCDPHTSRESGARGATKRRTVWLQSDRVVSFWRISSIRASNLGAFRDGVSNWMAPDVWDSSLRSKCLISKWSIVWIPHTLKLLIRFPIRFPVPFLVCYLVHGPSTLDALAYFFFHSSSFPLFLLHFHSRALLIRHSESHFLQCLVHTRVILWQHPCVPRVSTNNTHPEQCASWTMRISNNVHLEQRASRTMSCTRNSSPIPHA